MNLKKNNNFIAADGSKSPFIEVNNNSRSKISNLFIYHKIFDALNFSLAILIFTLSFLSFNSQRKWTNYYSIMWNIRNINNNLVDYISTTEEFYIQEIDKLDDFKKTTSRDLIYIFNKSKSKKLNKFSQYFIDLKKGIKDGMYQRGNL